MSDPESSGYRILSFRYSPKEPVGEDKQRDKQQGKQQGKQQDKQQDISESEAALVAASELPSLAPLMAALTDAQIAEPARDHGDMAAPGHDGNSGDTAPAPAPLVTFHPFGDLPPELRLKIWNFSFLPRVVELHPTRPNYSAEHDDPGRRPMWQSGCSNPALLSVCAEARHAALEHFRIAFPLASITAESQEAPFSRFAGDTATYNFSGASVDGKARLLHRVLHISPDHDTVALLGQDSDFKKLTQLMNSLRDADPAGVGISRLALSVRGWGYGGSAIMMKSLGRTILKDLEQLTLFMYGERAPPADWRVKGTTLDVETLEKFRRTGNRCELVPCEGSSASEAYRVWSSSKGRQFWDDDGRILRVGRNEMHFMDLEFKDGW